MIVAPGALLRATEFQALRNAALRAGRGLRGNAAAARWLCDLERNVLDLQLRLRAGVWTPGVPTVFRIRDPKPRVITAPPFSDRVVHHALCAELEPVLEAHAIPTSFACRRGKGAHAAVAAVQSALVDGDWYVKLDVRHFFETVRHDFLLTAVDAFLCDPPMRAVFARIVASGGVDGLGLPIGALTSQHLGNHLLGRVDTFALGVSGVRAWFRYMDDMIALVDDKPTAWLVVGEVDAFLSRVLGQQLKDGATRVAPTHVGVPFLGFRIWRGAVRLDRARAWRLRRRVRALGRRIGERGAQPRLVEQIRSALAWAAHADTLRLRRAALVSLSSSPGIGAPRQRR